MRIALLLLHPFSESMGSVIRVKELALGLERLGIESYILTPYERSFDLSCKVHVVSISAAVNGLGLSRIFYKLTKRLYYSRNYEQLLSQEGSYGWILKSLVKRIAGLLRRKEIDLIQLEQDVALPLGVGLSKTTGLPLVVDLHNVSTEELVASGILQRDSPQFLGLQSQAREYLDQADRVVVVSDCMKNYVIRNYGLKSSNVFVVPPGGRLHGDKSIIGRRVKPAKILYAGLVADREHVDLFVKCMPYVKRQDRNAQFYVTNKGDALGKIKKLARSLDVRPSFFWYEDYLKANEFFSSCHVGVLPSSNDLARKMGTPLKLFNYMSLGLPVVANDVGGWTEIIEQEKVGLVSSADSREFGETILRIVEDEELMREFALNGLKAIETKYNWDNSARTLLESYDGIRHVEIVS